MSKRDIPEPDLQPVAQPQGAYQQTQDPPPWSKFNPVLALEQWAQDEARDHGLVDIKFFPRIPGDPPPNLKSAAAEVLRAAGR